MSFEHLVANVAVKRLQVSMVAKEVLFQGIWPIEPPATNMARVVANFHVAFEMHLQIGRTGESRRALAAFVPFHSIVRRQVLC